MLVSIVHTWYWVGIACILCNLCVSCTLRFTAVADLGGVRGVQMHPPFAAINVFCVHNCTSPSNDYAAVACSNNNQA